MNQELPDLPGLPLPIGGDTRIFAIIGDPIEQVGSPALFNAVFRRRGVRSVLVPLHVSPADLPAALAGLRLIKNLDGIVVTVPHKIAVMELIDDVQPSGQRIGAVNAIRRTAEGRLIGDNFDGKGCIRALTDDRHQICGRHVLIIGAGGAGRAVAHAVADEKPARLHLFDLEEQRLMQLMEGLGRVHPDVPVETGPADPDGFDIVMNCTPLGMQPGDPYPVDPARIRSGTVVVDVVLKPATSPLIAAAAAKGCPVQRGVRMLEGQVDTICEYFGLKTTK